MARPAQSESAADTANLRVGEVADQLPNRPRNNLRPDIHEENHICRSFRHAGVNGGRLASMLFENNNFEKRILLLG